MRPEAIFPCSWLISHPAATDKRVLCANRFAVGGEQNTHRSTVARVHIQLSACGPGRRFCYRRTNGLYAQKRCSGHSVRCVVGCSNVGWNGFCSNELGLLNPEPNGELILYPSPRILPRPKRAFRRRTYSGLRGKREARWLAGYSGGEAEQTTRDCG